MRWQWHDNIVAMTVTWKQNNNAMKMAWKYHNYTMKRRWLRHTCSMTMTRPWQHIWTHVYWMIMIMTGLWGIYDMYDVTTAWQMALPRNYDEMTMTPRSCPSCVMAMVWSLYDHVIVSSWSCQDLVVIVSSSRYGCVLVTGRNIFINGHSWSFMSISLSCLDYFKVVPRPFLGS